MSIHRAKYKKYEELSERDKKIIDGWGELEQHRRFEKRLFLVDTSKYTRTYDPVIDNYKEGILEYSGHYWLLVTALDIDEHPLTPEEVEAFLYEQKY